MAKVYDQFDAAFKQVSAYAVLKDGNGSRRWFQELEANGYVVVNVIH